MTREQAARIARHALTVALALAAGWFLYATLRGAWSAFTWGRFQWVDYGKYANALWNAGHGNGFRQLVDGSYLTTHLSFTLALVGVGCRLWDHPFYLSFAQWLLWAAGAAVLMATARRLDMRRDAAAAVLLFFTGFPLAQSVLLSEYHGVSLYYLLLPWLLHASLFQPRLAWLPLVLLLGVREDAFLVPLSLLIWLGWRRRWPTGFALAALSLVYGILALTVLMPTITGATMLEHRPGSVTVLAAWLDSFSGEQGMQRARAALLIAAPLLAFAGRGRLGALLLVPILPILVTQLSGFPRQQALLNHYGAPVHAALAIALVAVCVPARTSAANGSTVRPPAGPGALAALALAVVTIGAHLVFGLLPGGWGKRDEAFQHPRPGGKAAVAMASLLPREGVLITSRPLTAYCANRRDLTLWDAKHAQPVEPTLVFEERRRLARVQDGAFLDLLRQGQWGMLASDGHFAILARGGPTAENATFLRRLDGAYTKFAWTRSAVGDVVRDDNGAFVRHWRPTPAAAGTTLGTGGPFRLPAGRYVAAVRLRVGDAASDGGRIGVFPARSSQPLATAPITASRSYSEQRLAFELPETAEVELRIIAGGVELWLDEAECLPQP